MFVVSILFLVNIYGLTELQKSYKNELAMTPPMGWMAWGRFLCEVDCQNHPRSCINEKLFMDMADMIVDKGFKEAGYNYVCVDDCWASKKRTIDNKLTHDPSRFPSGMKSLSDYIHSKGLKFGLYLSYGKHTCMGHTPGSIDHMGIDAETMAEWGVDYIKVDGCFTDPKFMDIGYPMMGYFLNKTGRPMVYSCSWPFYQKINKIKPDYGYVRKHCHLWRNYDDIFDNWRSVGGIIDHYADRAPAYARHHGPNGWTDPDQVMIGNGGLSLDQAKSHMAIWAMLAAPLMMSNDLRDIGEPFVRILTNRHVIAVNQDPLGSMGTVVSKTRGIMVWRKVLTNPAGSFAIAYFNPSANVSWRSHGLNLTLAGSGCTCLLNPCTFTLYDLYADDSVLRPVKSGFGIGAAMDWLKVEPNGVLMYKVVSGSNP